MQGRPLSLSPVQGAMLPHEGTAQLPKCEAVARIKLRVKAAGDEKSLCQTPALVTYVHSPPQ